MSNRKDSDRIKLRKIDATSNVLSLGLKWGAIVAVFWLVTRCAERSVGELAGLDTSANLAVNFLARVGISRWVAYGLAASGMIYGRQQKKLRKKEVGRLQDRVASLERRIDAKRSSSGLDNQGRLRAGVREGSSDGLD